MSMMDVHKLTKQYGAKKAVNDISFSLHEGRCVALLGPNGAGKTTTLNMLSGLLKPTSGRIQFQGIGQHADLRSHIGYLPQYTAFYNWMSGLEFLVYAGRLAHLTKQDALQRAKHLLQLVGLEEARNRRIGGYSGGMKQRLGLAQAMIHRPRLLILDEPVSALDPIGRREVLELLKQLKQETTILFSTHVLPDAEEVSDDVLIIRQGEIVISGSLADIRKEHQQPVIELEFASSDFADEWLKLGAEAAKASADATVDWQGHIMTITLKHMGDMESVRSGLLQRIAESRAPLRRFEIGQTTLEDLFMKAVQQ